MRAVILAGGRGTRLRPYTVVLPKPLMPIGEYPILEIIVRQIARCGFTRITMAVNHQADIIKAFFGSGEKWGIDIDYSLESMPLSTIGPLRLIADLPENFLVMNGDILTDLDFKSFYHHHVAHENIFTVSAYHRELKSDFGVLKTNDENRLIDFQEKPIVKYDVSMGVYMASKDILRFIPDDKPYGFDNLMSDLINVNDSASVRYHDGYWLDIGRQDDYEQAIDEFEKLKDNFLK